MFVPTVAVAAASAVCRGVRRDHTEATHAPSTAKVTIAAPGRVLLGMVVVGRPDVVSKCWTANK